MKRVIILYIVIRNITNIRNVTKLLYHFTKTYFVYLALLSSINIKIILYPKEVLWDF
ncbi:MAG: hypothetical protein K0S04_154 [Herbinix sp.]|nr:hypothetical protein [Herbinix sp.]